MATDQEKGEEQPIPRGQILFDRWFLLFALSLILSLVFYNAWDLLELISLPTR